MRSICKALTYVILRIYLFVMLPFIFIIGEADDNGMQECKDFKDFTLDSFKGD